LLELAKLISKWRKNYSSFSAQQIQDELNKAAAAITDMATRDQVEELDRNMFWECKGMLGLHGYAAAHHVMTEVEDAGGLSLALTDADLEEIKIKIEKRLKVYETSRAWLDEMVGTGLYEEDPKGPREEPCIQPCGVRGGPFGPRR